MAEFNAQSPAPNVSNLDGRFRWDMGTGLQQFNTSAKVVVPAPADQSDAVAIQEVVNAVDESGGGTIILRNGTYTLDDDIILPSNVHLLGESFGGVTLVLAGQFSIKATGTDAYSDGTVTVTKGSATVTGTDTLWNNLTTAHKIKINGQPYTIEAIVGDTEITLSEPYAGADQSGLSYLAAIFAERITVENLVLIAPAGSSAIVFQYTDLTTITHVVVPSPTIYGLSISDSTRLRTSVLIIDDPGVSGVLAVDTDYMAFETTVVNNAGVHGFDITGSTGTSFVSCPVNNSTVNGFNISGCSEIGWTYSQGNGGVGGIYMTGTDDCIVSNSDFSQNAGHGVEFDDDSNGNIMMGTIARNNGGYGVSISTADCDGNLISSNSLIDNSAGEYLDSGTSTIIINGSATGTNTGDQDLFKTIAVAGQSDVVADSTTDTLTLAAGANITLTTNATTDTVTIASAAGGGGDVVGSTTSVDNAVPRYHGTTGKIIQDSTVVISDSGSLLMDAAIDMQDNLINNLAEPVDGLDAANKDYVDAQAGGGTVDTVVAGNNIDVDATDPANPIVAVESLVQADIGGLTTTDSPQFAGVNVGHASDTTITRASAGVIAVEGSNVLVSGGALGTPSSGTLTNATGLPVAGITPSTTTAIGVGSVELGHASDTTLSRSAAGTLAVEGVDVITTSNTKTLTNKTHTAPRISTGSSIMDNNGNEVIDIVIGSASAVNQITMQNAATTASPSIYPSGGDTNLDLLLYGKGTGEVKINDLPTGAYAWLSWSPTLSGRLDDGDWTKSGAYIKQGKTVNFRLALTATAAAPAGGGSGEFTISLPVTTVSYGGTQTLQPIGQAMLFDNTGTRWEATLYWASTTTGVIRYKNVSGSGIVNAACSATVPFTWTTSDQIHIIGTVEAA